MALFHCPECGNMVSDKAEKCPNCGSPVQQRDKLNKSAIIIILIIALLALTASAIFFAYNAGKSSQAAPAEQTAEVKKDTVFVQQERHHKQPRTKIVENSVPKGQKAYFVVVSSETSFEAAKAKAQSIGGLVVKGYAFGATRYRVCYSMYYSNQEAKNHKYEAEGYFGKPWVLPDNTSSIVYR